MLFHVVEEEGQAGSGGGIELAKPGAPRKVTINKAAVAWATAAIGIFVVASFVAHVLKFAAGETVFLNLTVSLTSAGAGAFIGERLAIRKMPN